MTADVETIVVGAGAVGLACARALALKGQEVMVLERHDLIGSETSSRNSEVIHAGLYYPPGSLRARHCVHGKHLLYAFLAENGVPHERRGKLLVATSEDQLPKLEAIRKTALTNGVDDLTYVTGADAMAMEPALFCVAALLSPSTGVIDSHGYMLALEGHITSHGGQVVLNTPVSALSRTPEGLFRVETGGEAAGAITAKRLVLSAGLGATWLGEMLGGKAGYRVPVTYPAKGHYFAYPGRSPFQRLIYPMPEGAWLGIHLTLDIGGKAKFGPDLEWKDEISYDFEDGDGARQRLFTQEVRRYWPDLPAEALQPDYTGIRPKIYRQGEPVPDFAIHGPETHGHANLVALYGIESPGLTSSLAIAEHVAGLL
ncbi:MAG: NAD(P)/FAD-dependent oxidoreductase [Hyphomicrobiaceae bacterium]